MKLPTLIALDETPYFDRVKGEADPEAVALAVELINKQSGKFEPKTMPDQFTAAVKDYLRAKVEQRAPEVTIEKEGKPAPQVINIMDALKKSIQSKGRTNVRRVGKHIGNASPSKPVAPRSPRPKPSSRRTAH